MERDCGSYGCNSLCRESLQDCLDCTHLKLARICKIAVKSLVIDVPFRMSLACAEPTIVSDEAFLICLE